MDTFADSLILARDHTGRAARAELERAVRRGHLVRVIEGVYVAAATWNGLDDVARHLVRAHAAQHIRQRRLVFSHWTAAAAWELPLVDAPPESVHAVAERATGGRTDDHLVRHCVGIPPVTQVRHGLEVTDLARTVVDFARVAAFPAALVVADAALARDGQLDRGRLVAELGPPGQRGIARVTRVVALADGLSGSPGESVSRASMSVASIPTPILQHRFDDAEGEMYVDFWWPEFNLIGEFDGAVKYDDPAFLAGRTPQQALLDEKTREDRLRALGPRVTRWRWTVARSPARLRAQLLGAGIRLERYRNW